MNSVGRMSPRPAAGGGAGNPRTTCNSIGFSMNVA